MRRIVTIDKKSGKKKLVNVPSYDNIYVNNQMGQPAYDVGISSNGSGDDTPAVASGTQNAIFSFGRISGGNVNATNLVSNTGVVANNISCVGTIRNSLAAAGYGTDKAIFGYGRTGDFTYVSITNKVSNTGVMASDTTGVGTSRISLTGAGYGTDKAIFGYGVEPPQVSITNLVSNTGVVATDTTGVGTAREGLAAAGYGTDKAIFG